MTNELRNIERIFHELLLIQKREADRHDMDSHLNSEMADDLDEAISRLESIVYYDPTPIY
tara:strand:+ start:772 stop:951 length:180 start_codon:yes stop_codon:yes gene_type:complete